MRISDWSSDVCSSDLESQHDLPLRLAFGIADRKLAQPSGDHLLELLGQLARDRGLAVAEHGCHRGARRRQPVWAFIERSEGRRVGKGGVSTCSTRWSPYH